MQPPGLQQPTLWVALLCGPSSLDWHDWMAERGPFINLNYQCSRKFLSKSIYFRPHLENDAILRSTAYIVVHLLQALNHPIFQRCRTVDNLQPWILSVGESHPPPPQAPVSAPSNSGGTFLLLPMLRAKIRTRTCPRRWKRPRYAISRRRGGFLLTAPDSTDSTVATLSPRTYSLASSVQQRCFKRYADVNSSTIFAASQHGASDVSKHQKSIRGGRGGHA